MDDQTKIVSEEQLDDLLTSPRAQLVEFIRTVRSPLLILGGGGKMGPSLAVLARRAAEAAGHPLQVITVSRFSDPIVARGWTTVVLAPSAWILCHVIHINVFQMPRIFSSW